MVSQLVIVGSFLGMAVILAAVVGAVERRERYYFALGVVLLAVASSLGSGVAAGVLGLLGFVVVLASAVPMLQAEPASS